jgi:hypothetical protein
MRTTQALFLVAGIVGGFFFTINHDDLMYVLLTMLIIGKEITPDAIAALNKEA